MKYYTKQWQQLFEYLGTIDMYEPIIDKEYTDQEIADLYEDMMDKYIEEERIAYDEPPTMGDLYELDPEDFDPDDYIIGDIDADGSESNLRNPASYEEFMEYQKKEYEFEMREYESRPPFDEEEAREDFEEEYRDSLEEPDEDLPEWVRKSVDPRLIAMNVLPEGVYKKLMAEEQEKQNLFDTLDEAADKAMEDAYKSLPEECKYISDDLDELDGDYVVSVRSEGSAEDGSATDLTIELYGWDLEGDGVIKKAVFEKAQIIEDEGLSIETEKDEDGDIESNCDLISHELYYEDGCFEVHLMFENNEELKYLTLKCTGIECCQERA